MNFKNGLELYKAYQSSYDLEKRSDMYLSTLLEIAYLKGKVEGGSHVA